MSVFSYDNIVTPSNRDAVMSSKYLGLYGTGTHACGASSDGLIGRMHVARLLPKPINKCVMSPLIPVYQDVLRFENNSIVKNWLAFSSDEKLYFIHQISPTFIVLETTVMADTHWSTALASETGMDGQKPPRLACM